MYREYKQNKYAQDSVKHAKLIIMRHWCTNKSLNKSNKCTWKWWSNKVFIIALIQINKEIQLMSSENAWLLNKI